MKLSKKLIKTLIITAVMVWMTSVFSFGTTEINYGPLLSDIGVINANNGNLMESRQLSREEFVAIIVNCYKSDFNSFVAPNTPTFKDVPTNHWAYKYVEYAYKKNIVAGVSTTEFGLGMLVNYNQASLLLVKSLRFDVSQVPYQTAAVDISSEMGLNLIQDVAPSATINRGQMFELLAKALVRSDVYGEYLINKMGLSVTAIDKFKTGFDVAYNMNITSEFKPGYYEVRYSSGDIYLGEMSNDMRNGFGVYTFYDGEMYVGEFADGLYHGNGTMYYNDGTKSMGMWANNEFMGQ